GTKDGRGNHSPMTAPTSRLHHRFLPTSAPATQLRVDAGARNSRLSPDFKRDLRRSRRRGSGAPVALPVVATAAQAFLDGALGAIVGRLVVAAVFESVGKVLLLDDVAFVVVRVLIIAPVPQALHEWRRRVA